MTPTCPPLGAGRRQGLTLVEILVATALTFLLITIATSSFLQTRALTRRINARQQLHNSARLIYERMSWEVACLMQGAVFFATSSGTSVELIFLRGKSDNLDFTLDNSFGRYSDTQCDQVWTRWQFDPTARQLKLSSSTPERTFVPDANWTTSAGYNYKNNATFRVLPTPQRAVLGGSAATTLGASILGTGASGDIGDYIDLLNNASPIGSNCSDFAIEVVCQDDSVHSISTAANVQLACDGLYVDGRASGALSSRPRLIRTRFILLDPVTQVSEEFSFSFLAPAISPP